MVSRFFIRPLGVLLVVIGAGAICSPTAPAIGRGADGALCTGLCMSLTWDGTAYGTNNRADLALQPGTYWLTVNDPSRFHNFELRSCPGGTSACTSGDAQAITTVPDTPGAVTFKTLLKHGTYRLFCAAPNHERLGMYVDFEVGGTGQTG